MPPLLTILIVFTSLTTPPTESGDSGFNARNQPETEILTQLFAPIPPLEAGGEAEPITMPAPATSTPKLGRCQTCVEWARKHSQVGQPPRTDYAKNLPVNQSSPIPGYWVIFGKGKFGELGHTGLVRSFSGTELIFEGFNYPYCEYRILKIDIRDREYNIKGFWAEN